MRMRIAVAVVMVCAPMLASATIVELSPDLYLVVRERARREDSAAYKIAVIDEANRFAFSQGKVAVPVASRANWDDSYLRDFEYQFRLMSRAEALAARPTLADMVVAVDGANTCGDRAVPTVAALMPELSKFGVLPDRHEGKQAAPAPAAAVPSTQ